jgi:hypothetical protein
MGVGVLFGSNEGSLLRVLGRGDLIDGDDGEDEIEGGTGNDTLIGGADADTFVFWSGNSSDGDDVIADFSVGTDRIEFHGSVDSIEELQFVQFGAHTFIGYGEGAPPGRSCCSESTQTSCWRRPRAPSCSAEVLPLHVLES